MVHCAETNATRQPNLLKSKRRQRCESKIPHSSRSTGFLEAPALLLQLIKRDDMQKIQASGNQANYHQTSVQRIDCCMFFLEDIYNMMSKHLWKKNTRFGKAIKVEASLFHAKKLTAIATGEWMAFLGKFQWCDALEERHHPTPASQIHISRYIYIYICTVICYACIYMQKYLC